MIVFTNIKAILQTKSDVNPIRGKAMNDLEKIENAFLRIENDTIKELGSMANFTLLDNEMLINLEGKYVLPTWCDSHTHSVFASYRADEFAMRVQGKSYKEIADSGGGILNSALKINDWSEDELYASALGRINNLIKQGTGAIEIKSGYGLDTNNELKMLRVIQRLKETLPIAVQATFLGAHAVPKTYLDNKQGYVDVICKDMIPIIAQEKLASYCDIFIEKGFFDTHDAEQIFEAAKNFKLKVKAHANQLNNIGAIPFCIKHDAVSVDHLEHLNEEDYASLTNSNTVATLLPSAAFFLGDAMPNAKKLIEEDIIVSLATDYNPGSSPSGNFPFVISLAAIALKMSTEACINAATYNAAYAMGLHEQLGSIAIGKKANFIVTKPMSNIHEIPYLFGESWIDSVWINGQYF